MAKALSEELKDCCENEDFAGQLNRILSDINLPYDVHFL